MTIIGEINNFIKHPACVILICAIILSILQRLFVPSNNSNTSNRRILITVTITHDTGLNCIKSAIFNAKNASRLEIVVCSYIPFELSLELQPFRNIIKINNKSNKQYESDSADAEYSRFDYFDKHYAIVEIDQGCRFINNWDLYLENNLDMIPNGSILTDCPTTSLNSRFIRLNDNHLISHNNYHTVNEPCPSLFWSCRFSASKKPWKSPNNLKNNQRSSVQTYIFFKNNRHLFSPIFPLVYSVYELKKEKFVNAGPLDTDYTEHIGIGHSKAQEARAIAGLTHSPGSFELIAKYGSRQRASNICLELEKVLS